MSKDFVKVDSELSDLEIISLIKSGRYEYLHILIERYMPCIVSSAQKYSGIGCDFDDLVQEGRLAVFSAVKSYKPEKASFSTFVSLCIGRAVSDFVKGSNAKRRVPQSMITSIEDADFPDADSPEKILLDKESYAALTENIKNSLSNLEYCVLCSFLLGRSYAQIAEYLDIPEKSVDNALKRIRSKLRGI